jgi:hypothetical protein
MPGRGEDLIDQLAWDFSELDEKPIYSGAAPFHFTTEYFTVNEFTEAKKASALVCGEWPFAGGHRRMWGKSFCTRSFSTGAGGSHSFDMLTADLRCDCLMMPPFGVDSRVCFCPGDLMANVICEPCAWHHVGREADAVEAWHDHAWPGWRDLPVVPGDVRPFGGGFDKNAKKARAWVAAHYPTEWQTLGAPVVTDRAGCGDRHVSGYSPWGGYDINAAALRVPA